MIRILVPHSSKLIERENGNDFPAARTGTVYKIMPQGRRAFCIVITAVLTCIGAAALRNAVRFCDLHLILMTGGEAVADLYIKFAPGFLFVYLFIFICLFPKETDVKIISILRLQLSLNEEICAVRTACIFLDRTHL